MRSLSKTKLYDLRDIIVFLFSWMVMFSWEQVFRGIARQGRDGGLYEQTPDLCRCLVLTGWLGSWTGQTASMCTKVLCSLNTPPPATSYKLSSFEFLFLVEKFQQVSRVDSFPCWNSIHSIASPLAHVFTVAVQWQTYRSSEEKNWSLRVNCIHLRLYSFRCD